ncbi:MAG: hypothetical protein L6R38_008686 [Xanthoria sp. 2 TBL-2021]|nr:MAG: hypothetical protein L6R38_008686 [Xanthoria sp. 2 TBL-2021]
MAPANSHVVRQLQQLIYYHLDNHLLRNALFIAGRLQAYDPKNADNVYLIALCYYRLGQLKSAYDSSRHHALKPGAHVGCSYVFALACLGLGKYVEGSNALDKSRGNWIRMNSWNKHTESRRQYLPDAAAIYCLQGKLWQTYRDSNKAIESYAEALKLNPFMWDAFVGLCDLGVNVRIPNIFQMTPEMKRALSTSNSDESTLETLEESPATNPFSQSASNVNTSQPPSNNDPFTISKNRVNGDVRPNFGIFDKLNIGKPSVTPISGGDLDMSSFDTPTGTDTSFSHDVYLGKETGDQMATATNGIEPPLAPVRKARAGQGLGTEIIVDGPPKMRANTISSRSRTKAEPDEASIGRPPSRTHGVGERKRTISGQAAPSVSVPTTANLAAVANDPNGLQRRSTRLLRSITRSGTLATREEMDLKKKAKATGTKGRSTNPGNVGRVVSGNRIHSDSVGVDGKEQRRPSVSQPSGLEQKAKPASSEALKEKEALTWLFDLFSKLACAYFAQCHFRSQDAIQIYNTITLGQRDTPYILSQIARGYFEQGLYADAEKIYGRLRSIFPSQVEGMERYSTSLWHQKKETDLAFLAHELIDVDRDSPEAWCAVGNSFSVQKDHDQAIKCFKRAVQLDPRFAYAYTLQGHEYIANEENDKALAVFRSAVGVDRRHYNGWYGLGQVFEKQGKYEFAEQHYRTAAGVNPSNSLLITSIGTVLEKLKNPKAALVQYTKACDLMPPSAIARLKRARVLAHLKQPHAALEELKLLKAIAPDEANVFFMLGSVHKMLKQKSEAIRNWTIAANLDPKAQSQIKEEMERLEDMSDEDYDTLPMG